MLVACLVTAAACTGAPPPARHAAMPAPGAAGTAQSPAVAEDIRAQNALPGDPRWRVTHPAHLYQLAGFTDRADVLPGTSFGEFGEGYIRISFANSEANLAEAMRRIERANLALPTVASEIARK